MGTSGTTGAGIEPTTVTNLLLVTWAAGMLDALSYLRSGVFAANMTGNTVVLGLAVAGLWSPAWSVSEPSRA